MNFKRVLLALLCLLLVLGMPLRVGAQVNSGNSAEVTNEKKYDPLDLVVIVDSSGSMKYSDKNRTAISAVRMLINMMPADSRVGVINFNTKPTVRTQEGSGKGTLLSLEEFAGAEAVREAVNSIVYQGDTGIGNAVKAATDLLAQQGQPGRKKAIMLFTDGLNDFGSGPFAQAELAACEDNEVEAIQWAQNNDAVIYCVGYNYVKSNGEYSMGTNGEGLNKLSNMAAKTDGKFRSISTADEIEPLLVEFLADVCDLIYKSVDVIPGDGGFHECTIPVSPSVVEANIRIAGGDEDSIKNGDIHLYDPTGKEVPLRNEGNVRFDVDVNAASIKVVMPKSGDWLLTVSGIVGDDIHIGLLEHFKMNLKSNLLFPEGNPPGVAYTNDVVGIRAWLTYDGQELSDPAIYDAVTSATATFTSRANPDDKRVVNLTRDGLAFVGSFTVPADSYYDILLRLDWDTVYREDNLTVQSSNKPAYLKGQLENVSVNKGKTVTVDNIYQCVMDDENDAVTASIQDISNPDAVDVALDAEKGSITLTGKKWSSSLVTVRYTDAQGNPIASSFKVKVNDPVAIALIIGLIALIALAVLYLLWLAYRKSLMILGEMKLLELSVDNGANVQLSYSYVETDSAGPLNLGQLDLNALTTGASLDGGDEKPAPPVINMRAFYAKAANRNLRSLLFHRTFMGHYGDLPTDDARYQIYEYLLSGEGRAILSGADNVKLEGTPAGIKGLVFKALKRGTYLSINKKSEKSLAVLDGDINVQFKQKVNTQTSRIVRFKLKFTPSNSAKAKARAAARKKK